MVPLRLKFMKIINFLHSHILLLILILAAFLRLWNLASLPGALSPDEASLGYNAYSILKTAKDEYGNTLPIIFKSFGDYKPGLYIYITLPFVALFGLNEWSVRLPSALSGVLIVYLIFLVAHKFYNRKSRFLGMSFGVFAALVAATSPWLIFFSRGAWEANVALCLTLVGIYLFLKATQKPIYILFAILTFSLTLITYQGAKLSTAIVTTILLFTYWRDVVTLVRKNTKLVIISLAMALLVALPVLLSFSQGQTGRLKVFSVFSYPRPEDYLKNFLDEAGVDKESFMYELYYSEAFNFKRGILGRWFNHFSGRFLFFEGDYQNPRHSAPNHGMLLLPDIILLTFGVIFIIKSKNLDRRVKTVILVWLLLAPLPAVLSRDQVQSVRALNSAVPMAFLAGAGIYYLLAIFNKLRFKVLFFLALLIIGPVSFIYFLDAYYVHYNKHNAKYLPYGYKEVINKISFLQGKYKRIVFQQSYNQPYIYFLFYQKYDPATYQKQASLESGGIDVGLVKRLDNIDFINFSWPYATGEKSTLLIGNDVAIPYDFSKDHYNQIYEVKFPDGFMTAFRLVETK